MIWRLRDLPELQHLTASERHQLLRSIATPMFYIKIIVNTVARSLAVILLLYLSILATSGFYYTITGGNQLLPHNPNTTILLMMVVTLMLVLLPVMYLRMMSNIQSKVRDALLDAEYAGETLPVCPDCAYGLEGVTASACPECGRTLRHT